VQLINRELLDSLTAQASVAARRRKNYNFHHDAGDLLQRMLNAFEPFTYVRPHQHADPPKREVFLLLKGRCAVVFYNNEGEIVSHVILDTAQGNWGVEIAAGEWHSVISLAYGTVVYEIKDGPYEVMSDKCFASWAPAEDDDHAQPFLLNLMQSLNVGVEEASNQ